MVGYIKRKVGTVELNNEHKSNILSLPFMEDVRRSLEAMEIDEDMKVVVMRSKKHEVFSMGTQLNYLFHRKRKKEDKIYEYFDKMCNFQHFVATYPKPLLAMGTGILSNDK